MAPARAAGDARSDGAGEDRAAVDALSEAASNRRKGYVFLALLALQFGIQPQLFKVYKVRILPLVQGTQPMPMGRRDLSRVLGRSPRT